MENFDIVALKDLLAKPQHIVVVPHRGPDGDAMGAVLAMYQFLKISNQNVTVISPNAFPDFLAWMPDSDKILTFEDNKAKATEILNQATLIFTLDFNALHRVGEMEKVLQTLSATFVMIDHHQSPDNYAKFTFSDVNYGSTCEMIYDFIEMLGKQSEINQTIATCIYTGILTDSGGFRFPKTTAKTHRIVANLIELGAKNTEIPVLLYDNNSYNRLQILGRALQNMQVLPELHTSFVVLSQEDLNECHYENGDTEGVVNYGLTIKNILFSAIFIEKKEEKLIKISFRSQGSFDVNQFARDYFEGGGHCNAAGGKSTLSLTETVEKFKALLHNTHPNL